MKINFISNFQPDGHRLDKIIRFYFSWELWSVSLYGNSIFQNEGIREGEFVGENGLYKRLKWFFDGRNQELLSTLYSEVM